MDILKNNQLARFLCVCTFLCFSGVAGAQEVNPLYLDVVRGPDSIVLKWTPVTAEAWGSAKNAGYRIERFTLAADDLAGFNASTTDAGWDALSFGRQPTILPQDGSKIMMADSTTMRANGLIGRGFLGAMATMLYDSAFNDGTDVDGVLQQQYEMAAFGAISLSDSTGAFLGARLEDSKLDTNGVYLYRIVSIANPTIRQEVAIHLQEERAFTRYFADLKVDLNANPFADQLEAMPNSYRFSTQGKAFIDSIVVRWAPLDPILLRNSPEQGYVLQKQRVIPGQPGEEPTLEMVNDSMVVRPWTPEQFAAYFNTPTTKDSLVLVSAQVLYGELQTTDDFDRKDALDNQLAYGLQAADQSPLAANALGLRFVDYDVAPGETYQYAIQMPLDSIDPTAFGVFGNVLLENTYSGPEEIFGLTANEGEYVISLIMPKENGDNYSQYYIERSAVNGTGWTSLSKQPIIFEADEKLIDDVRYYFYPDSVATLYQPFRYRIRGRNAFQEYSPWAEVTAMARDRTAPPVAFPNDPEMLSTEIVRISWDGEMSATAPDLAGYYVKMGHYSSVEDQPIVSELLPAGSSSWEYHRPGMPFTNDSSYFFQVAAVDTAGNMSNSFPVALRIIDSIPPAPPIGLQAKMDTNGVVTLLWEASPEKDAAGYQVYFANDTTETFVQITKDDLSYNYFKDTVALNTLNEALYYRVSAFDRSYNNSEWSDVLRVERPDVVAPTPPVLLLPKPNGDGVTLSWRPSSSTDAVSYLLYRRVTDDESGQWNLIDSVAATSTSFADTSARVEVSYQYTMYTLDDAGLRSEQANVQSGRRIFTADVGGVEEISVALQGEGVQARPQVQWTYEKPGEDILREADYRFMLYRATGDGALARYKQLKSKEPSFTDTAVKAGMTYRYALMVVYSNGKKSGLSGEQAVTIPKDEE